MKKNGALDIICIIFSVLLSIALVPSVICTVIAGTVTDVVQPETVTEMITDVDYSALITENVDMTQLAGEMDIPEEKVQEIMESDLVKDIVAEYAEGMSGALTGNIDNITVDDIMEIVNNNKAEIVDFVKENAQGEIDEATIEQELDAVLQENVEELVYNMPQPADLVEEMPPEATMAFEVLNSGIILKVFLGVTIVLALLIFVMRLWNFAGFLWLSINGFVSSVFLGLIYVALSFAKTVLGVEPELKALTDAVINGVLESALTGLMIVLGASVIFMVAFFVIRKYRKSKKEA